MGKLVSSEDLESFLASEAGSLCMDSTEDRKRLVKLLKEEYHVREREGCTLYITPCPEHGFVHGAEAEELREGIEEAMEDYQNTDTDSVSELQDLPDKVQNDLQDLLDKVDARDSLAFQEAKDLDTEEDD